jgi:superfamily I DNA/RNA helicase
MRSSMATPRRSSSSPVQGPARRTRWPIAWRISSCEASTGDAADLFPSGSGRGDPPGRAHRRTCAAGSSEGRRHALSWSGTFHAIGARLLREYAELIGLDRAFTIHDREDSADLMNLLRHDLGLSKTEERFRPRTPASRSIRVPSTQKAPLDEVLGNNFPWCVGWEEELKSLFGAYVEAKQQNVLDYDDLLLYWAQMMQVDRPRHQRSVRSRAGR